jgi:hypothetical protein
MIGAVQRVVVKLYASEPGIPDNAFVPIFHQWIRERALPLVLLDVADYTHVPESPGVMLISYETAFALDRSDGRFGLSAQQRRPMHDDPIGGIAATLRQALAVAERLEKDRRVRGRLEFDRASFCVEANDRLRAPNTASGFDAMESLVRRGVERVYPDRAVRVTRAQAEPRDRLTVDVRISGETLS